MSDRAYAKVQVQQKTLTGSSSKNRLLQRTCACGQHTMAGGECATCRSEQSTLLRPQRMSASPSASIVVQSNAPAQENVSSLNAAVDSVSHFGHDFSRIPVHTSHPSALQTKLTVNQPGDPYEQEADRVAEQVMRMPASGTSAVQKDTSLMRKESSGGAQATQDAPPVVNQALSSGGQLLDANTRATMEPRFGQDFSGVRVHTDEQAAESAQAVNARAYTVGRDVVFGAGQYAPGTSEGRRLLAHELTHVVQQTRGGTGTPVRSHNDSLEQNAKHAESALTANDNFIEITGSSTPGIARAPKPDSAAAPQQRHHGLTDAEKKLLNQIRKSKDPKGKAIVGVLIAEDGQKFEVVSGGGRGGADFNIHIEGKAIPIMIEKGITKATLLSEKESCQICDRSVYPAEEGPEAPLISSRTGKPIDRQTPKINSALPKGSELTVVDPDSASTYRGIKSTPNAIKSTGSPPVAGGAGANQPEETATKPSVSSAKPLTGNVKASEDAAPKNLPLPKTTPPKASAPAVEEPTIEGSQPKSARGSSASTGMAAFHIALLLLRFLPDPIEEQAVKEKLNQEWNSSKWQARLKALQPEIEHTTVSIYYNIKFKILYSVRSSPKPLTFSDQDSVEGVEILEINLSKDNSQDCGKKDPPGKPEDATPIYGGGFHWKAQSICTTSAQVAGGERVIGPTYGLTRDTEIRDAINTADAATIERIPTAEKIRIIDRLLDGWVSDADIGGIRKVYHNTPSSQRPNVKNAIEGRIPDLTSIRQRTMVRVILAGG